MRTSAHKGYQQHRQQLYFLDYNASPRQYVSEKINPSRWLLLDKVSLETPFKLPTSTNMLQQAERPCTHPLGLSSTLLLMNLIGGRLGPWMPHIYLKRGRGWRSVRIKESNETLPGGFANCLSVLLQPFMRSLQATADAQWQGELGGDFKRVWGDLESIFRNRSSL